MIYCTLNLREISHDGKLKLRCAGSGVFDVFSGLGEFKNNADYYMEKNGPIPPGVYWIVERPDGGLRSWLKQKEKEWRTGNSYDDWFALYKDDGLINDRTIVVFKSFVGCGHPEELNDIHALITYHSPWKSSLYNNPNNSLYQRRSSLYSGNQHHTKIDLRPCVYRSRERSAFRLHPLRPDGTGVSDGCITFYNREDFYKLRGDLLRAHTYPIPGTQLMAYGKISVTGNN